MRELIKQNSITHTKGTSERIRVFLYGVKISY